MSTMPPTPRRRSPAKARKTESSEYYEWDTFVEEAHVDQVPFKLRVRVPAKEDGAEDTFEMVTVPVPSGSSYINLAAAQQRGDVAGILVNLTKSGVDDEENAALFDKLMFLMSKANFPVVDMLAERVLRHYFNLPPRGKDNAEGGAGE